MKRVKTLTIELERVRIITRKPRKNMFFCELCRETREFISRAEAFELANIIGVERRGGFHIYRPAGGDFFVCLDSILESSK